jgi:hypothetical protein
MVAQQPVASEPLIRSLWSGDGRGRAETALVELARDKMHRLDDARSVIRQLFRTEVDLIPDQQNKTLTVRLHPLTAEVHDQVLRYICQELTSTETVFPTTNLQLIYEIAGSS